MSTNGTNIELTTITCGNTSEAGSDEVYIKYSIDGDRDKRFPDSGYHSMSDGDTWDVNLPLSFKESAVVSLYDRDPAGDDFLGSHSYAPSDPQPESVTVSNSNGASYKLSTTVFS